MSSEELSSWSEVPTSPPTFSRSVFSGTVLVSSHNEIIPISDRGYPDIHVTPGEVLHRIPLEEVLLRLPWRLSPDLFLSGWLEKRGAIRKNWKRRWCVLAGGEVTYSVKPADITPKGVIPLREAKIFPYGLVELDKAPLFFTISTPSRDFLIKASTPDEKEDWVAALSLCVSQLSPGTVNKQ